MRQPLLAFAAVAVTAVALLGSHTPSAAAARPDQFGLASTGNLHNLGPAQLANELDAMKYAGARWIRFDLNWLVIQAGGPRSWNWAPFDRVVNGARRRGLNVLGVVAYTPAWARRSGHPLQPPSNLRALTRFTRVLARRYRGRVNHFEVWNEPNLSVFWPSGPNPRQYVRLLRAASIGLHRGNRRAYVITGGLSPATNTSHSIAPVRFLRRVYALGGRRWFDAVGHHASTFPALATVRASWSAWHQMFGTRPSLRSVMVRHGDGRKKIWITEYGAPTAGSRAVSELRQAEILASAYRAVGRHRWAGPLFWFSFRDGAMSGEWQEYCGLLRADYSWKPAFATYRALALLP